VNDQAMTTATAAGATAKGAAHRPPGVPDDYVRTPSGYFHPSCVVEVAANERVRADGRIERDDGTVRDFPACAHPHYDARGHAVGGQGELPSPGFSGWAEDAQETTKPISAISGTWHVPGAPLTRSNQIAYYWLGAESREAEQAGMKFVLQPVLAWDGNDLSQPQWSISSWNCCVNGTTWHSAGLAVQPGDEIQGSLKGTSCSGSLCGAWKIVAADLTTGQSAELDTTSFGFPVDWLFGGVLEAEQVNYCSELPVDGTVTFSGVQAFDTNGSPLANSWQPEVLGVSPNCNFGVSASFTTVTLDESQPSRLDVFTRGTDNQLWQREWNPTQGWGGNEPLGGTLTAGVAAVSWGPGRYDVFSRDASDNLVHKYWDDSRGSWSSWQFLAGPILETPAVTSWGPGRLDVFYRGTDSGLRHIYWNGSTWSGVEDWGFPLGVPLASGPAAVSWGPNRIDIFATGADRQLEHLWYDHGWSTWESLGGSIYETSAVASWGAGRLDIFARDLNSQLVHTYYDASTVGWGGWDPLGATLTAPPAAVSRGFGSIDVFFPSTGNEVLHKWWSNASGWSGLEHTGTHSPDEPAAATW
jgi:hypothetical protein